MCCDGREFAKVGVVGDDGVVGDVNGGIVVGGVVSSGVVASGGIVGCFNIRGVDGGVVVGGIVVGVIVVDGIIVGNLSDVALSMAVSTMQCC